LATLALLWAFGGSTREVGETVRKVGPLSAFSITARKTMSTQALRKTCATTGTGRDVFLVTGAAGFVGSHVATALKERGDGVVGLDNVNDYYPRGLKRARMKKLKELGVHVVEADLNDATTVRKVLDTCKVTIVLHLAAQAGVRYAVKNPGAYVHSNVAGFVTLLEEIVRTEPVPKVIFASSSSVYGLNTKVPFSETDVTDSPASLYAATKKADELLAHTYNHIHGVALTALRFFTVYGPYGRPDMAYFSFANNIVKGKPIKIFKGHDGGELARDFTYIDDVVRGTIAACDTSDKSGKRADGSKPPFRVYNLGNTNPVTVSAFVDSLERALGKTAKRDYVPMPKTGDVPFTHADISAAKKDLQYNPTVGLDEGLRHFVQWYEKYYKDGANSEDTNYVPM
jgi:UDP-glucuronate 4-epimerase